MKFRSKPLSKPEKETIRVVEYFAWFPVTIGEETRWLETVRIEQEYYWGWDNIKFIDPELEIGTKPIISSYKFNPGEKPVGTRFWLG